MQPPAAQLPSAEIRARAPGEPPYEPRSSSFSEMAARPRPTLPPGSGKMRISSRWGSDAKATRPGDDESTTAAIPGSATTE